MMFTLLELFVELIDCLANGDGDVGDLLFNLQNFFIEPLLQ